MRVVAACLATAITLPAWAAEPAHCYTKITPDSTDFSPPETALPGNEENPFATPLGDGSYINTRLQHTLRRAFCNLDVESDITFWTELYRREGCSEHSPIARSFRWFWTAGVDELKAEQKERMQNAPRDSNGLVAKNYVLSAVDFCISLRRDGAWHLSTEN